MKKIHNLNFEPAVSRSSLTLEEVFFPDSKRYLLHLNEEDEKTILDRKKALDEATNRKFYAFKLQDKARFMATYRYDESKKQFTKRNIILDWVDVYQELILGKQKLRRYYKCIL